MTQEPVRKSKIKIPIGFKLVSMIALMLFISTMAVIFVATNLFTTDKTAFIYDSTSNAASQLADQTHSYFQNLSSVLTTMTEIQNEPLIPAKRKLSMDEQFGRNDEILAVATWKRDAKG